ncbi:MAG: hypothetical protein ACR2NZ_13220 [Rubripirellula sp.]
MDQLKTQLAVAVKYGFWISSALVLLVSLGIWYMTTSSLDDENQKQTQKINSSISTVRSVQGELSDLPNDLSHEKMEELISQRQEEVLTSWEDLYDRQKDILVWPTGIFNQELVDEYKDKVPIETFIEFPTEEADELETTLRRQYATYIKNVLPTIAEIAKTEWTAEFESSSSISAGMMDGMGMSMGGFTRPGADVDITGESGGPLVEWDSGSQSAVLKDLFPWRGSLPSTLDVYYSQENLWILRQLLAIVAEVNGEARQPYQAKIHQITRIGIGRSVKTDAGYISKPGQGSVGGMMGMGGMDEMGMDGMDEMSMGGFDMDEGMGGATVEAVDPADNRYLNGLLEPIDGSSLRSALTSNSPSDASVAVAKRVPVMLSLNMDQRAVHELVAICGSADLMVEVSQVRVLPKNASSGGMGGMGGMDMGMDDEGMGMEMGMGGMGGMGGGMTRMPGSDEVEEFPLDMSVEIYGIINIYNPPDPVKLGVEQVDQDTVIDGESMSGEAVADTTPVPVTPDPVPTTPAVPTAPEPETPPADPSTPDTTTPDGTAPEGTTPDGTTPDGTAPTEEGAVPPVAASGISPTPAILPTQP